MNKNGFTLVELLTTIVVVALIAGIGMVSYTFILNREATRTFESYRDTMHAEAIYYLVNSYDKVNWQDNKARITLTELRMDPINNPKDPSDLCQNSYVDVTRTRVNNVLSITYNVCLKCTSFTDDNGGCKEYEN